MTHTHTTPAPVFTLGIHYFCDHRCWRCAQTAQCAVFARWSSATRARKMQSASPGGRVASVLAVSLEVTMEEAVVLAAEAARLFPDGPMVPPRPTRAAPDLDTAMSRAQQDPLVVRGGEYAQSGFPVLQALHPILSARGDVSASDAAERLEEMLATVASKVFRAVSSALDADFDPSDVQSDSNGSAKVALLLIEESRQAWRVLMRPGCALADGLPARFIGLLDALEADLQRRFPRAFEFVRPGFDTGDTDDRDRAMSRALLATPDAARAS